MCEEGKEEQPHLSQLCPTLPGTVPQGTAALPPSARSPEHLFFLKQQLLKQSDCTELWIKAKGKQSTQSVILSRAQQGTALSLLKNQVTKGGHLCDVETQGLLLLRWCWDFCWAALTGKVHSSCPFFTAWYFVLGAWMAEGQFDNNLHLCKWQMQQEGK